MPKTKIDKELVIKEAAYIANKMGIENLSLKTLAAQLGVKSPSLYNHVDGLLNLPIYKNPPEMAGFLYFAKEDKTWKIKNTLA